MHLQLQLHQSYRVLKEYKLQGGSPDLRENVDKVFYWGQNSKTSMVGFSTGAQEQCLKDRFTHRETQLHGPKLNEKIYFSFFGTINTFYFYS